MGCRTATAEDLVDHDPDSAEASSFQASGGAAGAAGVGASVAGVAGVSVGGSGTGRSHRKRSLDSECFRGFAPLLEASQDYAGFSGCRFRSNSFQCLLRRPGSRGSPRGLRRGRIAAVDGSVGSEGAEEGADEDHSPGASSSASASSTAASSSERCRRPPPRQNRSASPRARARARAAPAVREFMERLREGEAALLEEIEKAWGLVMAESVRNSMITMCRAMGIFPPELVQLSEQVLDDDCAYEDASAPLPVIAQRLYNDKQRRDSESALSGGRGCRLERRMLTAAFLIDFASEAGVKLPPMPQTQESMLEDFAKQVAAWGAESPASVASPLSPDASGAGVIDERVCPDATATDGCANDGRDGENGEVTAGSSWFEDVSSWGEATTRYIAEGAVAVISHSLCTRRITKP